MKSLKAFVKEQGNQEKAAQKIGISFVTINRILNGHNKPSPLLKARLSKLGVKI